jgi:hypothetical protein
MPTAIPHTRSRNDGKNRGAAMPPIPAITVSQRSHAGSRAAAAKPSP